MYYLGDKITSKYEHSLKLILKEKYISFKKILKESEAVIAGSNVLSKAFTKKRFYANDFDIYVNIANSKPLLEFIFGGASNVKKCRKANFGRYCQTFLTKNGIKEIYSAYEDHCFNTSVDVMTVRNSTTPLNVVKSFDLTFCQVWYDGEKVYANYPEHIETGCGKLEGDYIIPFLNNNKFLLARYDKYTSRGFTITIDYPDEYTIERDMMGISKVRKFKDLSIKEIESIYNTDSKKKHFISHFLLEMLTDGACGYDSEEYEDVPSLSEFEETKVVSTIQNFRDKLAQTATSTNNNMLILHWLRLFEGK